MEAWYLEERARQLAIVHLSRRNDLAIIKQPGPDYGLDLLVSLTGNKGFTGKVFGVQVKGVKSFPHPRRNSANGDGVHFAVGDVPVPTDIPFPLCLFVFAMETDEGYYKWLVRPNHGSRRRLQLRRDAFNKLDAAALDRIVAEVNEWYEHEIKIPA